MKTPIQITAALVSSMYEGSRYRGGDRVWYRRKAQSHEEDQLRLTKAEEKRQRRRERNIRNNARQQERDYK